MLDGDVFRVNLRLRRLDLSVQNRHISLQGILLRLGILDDSLLHRDFLLKLIILRLEGGAFLGREVLSQNLVL